SLSSSRIPRTLHSFPTRRSSDLCHRQPAQRRLVILQRVMFIGQANVVKRAARAFGAVAQWFWGNLLGPDLARTQDDRVKEGLERDRKSTRLNSSHVKISYAVFCL